MFVRFKNPTAVLNQRDFFINCVKETKKQRKRAREVEKAPETSFILSITLTLWAVIGQKPVKEKIVQGGIWRLNYFRDNLYDFLWERSRKSWGAKAGLQPWLGHADIDLTVKTGAGELWCHDSVLSLLLSLKEVFGRWWGEGAVEVSEWETKKDKLG